MAYFWEELNSFHLKLSRVFFFCWFRRILRRMENLKTTVPIRPSLRMIIFGLVLWAAWFPLETFEVGSGAERSHVTEPSRDLPDLLCDIMWHDVPKDLRDARFPLFFPKEFSPASLCDPETLPLRALTNGDFAFGPGWVDYRGGLVDHRERDRPCWMTLGCFYSWHVFTSFQCSLFTSFLLVS